MTQEDKKAWLEQKGADLFTEAVLYELYSRYLFSEEQLEGRDFFHIPREERKDIVILSQLGSQQEYEPKRIRRTDKRSQSIIKPCKFWHDVCFDEIWIKARDYGIKDIERKVKEGGKQLAERINLEFERVLLASVEETQVIPSVGLDDALAQISDQLSETGFSADRFLFPEGFRHRLIQRGVIKEDQDIHNEHYAGKTNTGLYAFRSRKLPEDTFLVLDSTPNVTITIGTIPQAQFREYPEHSAIGVRGVACLNPIVREKRSIIAVGGLDQMVDLMQSHATPVLATPAELTTKASGADFIKPDLDKLAIRKELRHLTCVLIEDANRAHHAEAYVAAVLLYRSVIEAILLGLLLKRKSKAEDPSGRHVPRDRGRNVKPVEEWKLEEMIKRAVAMGLLDDTDESSIRTLQNYGNLVHAARILRKEPYIDPPEDAKIVRSHLIKLLKRYGAI